MSEDPDGLLGRMNAALDAASQPSPGRAGPQVPAGIGTVTASSPRANANAARGASAPASLQRSTRQTADALRRAIARN